MILPFVTGTFVQAPTHRPDKSLVLIKPAEFDNQIIGYEWLQKHLNNLEVSPAQILIGMEATGRYWETCYYYFFTSDKVVVNLRKPKAKQGNNKKDPTCSQAITAAAPSPTSARPAICPSEKEAEQSPDEGVVLNLFDGADSAELGSAGELILTSGDAEIQQNLPVIYQEVNGKRQTITGAYISKGNNKYGFKIDKYGILSFFRGKTYVLQTKMCYLSNIVRQNL